jgi:hypothetical protein
MIGRTPPLASRRAPRTARAGADRHDTSHRIRETIVAALQPALANQKSVADAAKEMARVGQLVLDKIPK